MKHISYLSYYRSPIGYIRINTNEYAILSITFIDELDREEKSNSFENELSKKVKEEIKLYFEGKLTSFSFYNYFMLESEAKILEIVSHIPYGETMTYKEVSSYLGTEKLVNVVIKILNNNSFPILIPCHRVVKDEDRIGSYVTVIEKKGYLLNLEAKYKKETSVN